MDIIRTNERNNEELIKQLKERLDWYNFCATDEQYNEEEVGKIVELLTMLEPIDSAQMGDTKVSFEKFMQYRENKQADVEKVEALRSRMRADAAKTAEENAHMETAAEIFDERIVYMDKKNRMAMTGNVPAPAPVAEKGKIRLFVLRHKRLAGIAAALCVVLLAAGGTMGVASAEKNQGFFHWLERDDSGSRVVLNPQQVVDNQNETVEVYYNEAELPEEYKQYAIDIDLIESLADYDLSQVEIHSIPNFYVRILHKFVDSKNKVLVDLITIIYNNRVIVQTDKYIDYSSLYEWEDENITINAFVREDSEGQKDYLICYYLDNVEYQIQGKNNIERLEQIMEEYLDTILK